MYTYPQAKINLGLYVVERRPDGYHNLQTAFYPVPLTDTLQVVPSKTASWSLQTVGTPVEGRAEDNLVVRVYLQMREEFHLPPVDIYLDKHIPCGAGLGGGSSDAAEMMKRLNELFRLHLSDDALEQRLAMFGADCPFFVRRRPVLAEGIGDVFSPLTVSLKGWTIALVKPPVHVSTREAYADVSPRSPHVPLHEALRHPVEQWRRLVFNDFEPSVFARHPEIAAVKDTLYDMGAQFALMTGSGATVFALFKHRIEELPRVFADCFTYQSLLREF